MKTNYPWQICSVIHKPKLKEDETKKEIRTLAFDAVLRSPEETGDRMPSPPLEMHEGFSVYKGTLIIKRSETDKDLLVFNIPAKSVPYIHKKTTMVMESQMSGSAVSSDDDQVSGPAYTVTIKSGNLSGKTPAQVLMESAANVSRLEKQRDFLQKNVGKYPANQVQIDAINQAIQLQKEGKLSPKKNPAGSIVIYETEPKYIKIPEQIKSMVREMDEKLWLSITTSKEELWLVYQIQVTYDPSMNLPVNLKVRNCFAPVDKKKGNEIQMSLAIGKKERFIRLTEEEWFNIIDRMKATKIMFEDATYQKQMKLANKISFENAKAAKESKK